MRNEKTPPQQLIYFERFKRSFQSAFVNPFEFDAVEDTEYQVRYWYGLTPKIYTFETMAAALNCLERCIKSPFCFNIETSFVIPNQSQTYFINDKKYL